MESNIIVNNASFDKGSAYGVILLENEHKDVGYGSGPWKPQNALLPAINMGLGSVDPKSNARVHLPESQVANYIKSGVVEKWQENGWKKMNGSTVEVQEEWESLLEFDKEIEPDWIGDSDHKLMSWARKAALCAVAQVDMTSLRQLDDVETVSKAKAGQFWMVAKDAGHNDQSARKLLSEFGVISAKDLPKSEFESAVERAKSRSLVKKYKEMTS